MVEGDGKTEVDNGMPPAVTVPDPDPVANNSTMGKPGLFCSYEGCGFETPKYSGPEAIQALKLHIMTAHPHVFKMDPPPSPPPTQGDQLSPAPITIPGLEALVTQLQQLAVRPECAQPAARSEALVRPRV